MRSCINSGLCFERFCFASNGIRARFGLHFRRIGLRFCAQLPLRRRRLRLRDPLELLVLGLQGLLLGLHFGFDGAVEFRGEIEIRDREIRDADGILDALFP